MSNVNSQVKSRKERQALRDQLHVINESIRIRLSQATYADTHGQAYAHYATIQELATTAQTIVVKLESLDLTLVQEKML
jgi:hypothetical protein